MTLGATLSPAARFSLLIRGIHDSVFGRSFVLGPLGSVICNWLVRTGLRFRALADRVRAGKVSAQRPRGMRAGRAADAADVEPAVPLRPSLPRKFAWLLPLVPGAANFGSQLLHLLEDPEMAALVAASPAIQALLRSMCRMLAVSPLPALLQPTPRAPRARPRRRPTSKARATPKRPATPERPVLGAEGPPGGLLGLHLGARWRSPGLDAANFDAGNFDAGNFDGADFGAGDLDEPGQRARGGFSSA